jgi:hypothetical protein
MTAMRSRRFFRCFLLASLLPVCGCEVSGVAGLHGGQPGQDVGEVVANVDFVTAAVFYYGIKDGTFAPGLVVSYKQPIFLPKFGGTDGVGILVARPHLVSLFTRPSVR